MQHSTLRYIHNGAKILCILTILAFFQKTFFRIAFGGLCSPLATGSVQKYKNSLGMQHRTLRYIHNGANFFLLSKSEASCFHQRNSKIRIVEEFIAPTVCANPITVICPVMPTVTTPHYQNGGSTYHGAMEYLKNSAAVCFPAKL